MKQKSGPDKVPAEQVLKDIRRQTRRQYSAEEKIRIVLEGLRGEESISELCRREGIAASMYYGWSKEFLEAGKRRLEHFPITSHHILRRRDSFGIRLG
jgi:transposase